jgi:hypothetical protein
MCIRQDISRTKSFVHERKYSVYNRCFLGENFPILWHLVEHKDII